MSRTTTRVPAARVTAWEARLVIYNDMLTSYTNGVQVYRVKGREVQRPSPEVLEDLIQKLENKIDRAAKSVLGPARVIKSAG